MERNAGGAEPPGQFQTVLECPSRYGHRNVPAVYPGRSGSLAAFFLPEGLEISGQGPAHSCGDILLNFPRFLFSPGLRIHEDRLDPIVFTEALENFRNIASSAFDNLCDDRQGVIKPNLGRNTANVFKDGG